MWRSDFTATHYRSRAGCLECPRFDRNLTATGCLSLSLPVRLGELNPDRSAVLSLPVSGCQRLYFSRADSLSSAREVMPPGVLRAARQEHS